MRRVMSTKKGKAKPKCMEKPLDWSGVSVKTLCPKCGSGQGDLYQVVDRGRVLKTRWWYCDDCGHEEKVVG